MLDDVPLAVLDDKGSSPILYLIHTDQIGTPQKITDGSMNIVWDGVFDPFGNSAAGGSLSLTNLRFPGQYFDGESGVNQNWNRDYDPTTGRYIQSDPVGLLSGTNTYVYVDGSPTNFIDFFGLITHITFWDPFGWWESAFGHTSADVNGTGFSFGPNGVDTHTLLEYNRRN